LPPIGYRSWLRRAAADIPGAAADIVACEFINQVAVTTQQIGPVAANTFESMSLTGAVNLNAGEAPAVICVDSNRGTRSVRVSRTGSQGVRLRVLIADMFEALAQGASHPAVAAWLAVGTVGVAAVVVAMAWA
jgi:hypothetical protein